MSGRRPTSPVWIIQCAWSCLRCWEARKARVVNAPQEVVAKNCGMEASVRLQRRAGFAALSQDQAPSVCTPSREASAGTGSDESPVTTLTRPGRVLLTIAGYVCPQELVCTTVARRERNCLKSRTTRLQEPWLKNFEPVRTGVVRWHLGPAGAGAVCEPTTASSHRSVLDGQGPEARRGRG